MQFYTKLIIMTLVKSKDVYQKAQYNYVNKHKFRG